ncbi:hypothetical protein AGMMS49521_2060 [Campylobacterota bacterium]|nr:hypothetical protein AGMMS49521_2060 [Campylobacterota bacterium]GHV03152.1 hypothetical protein AGMMS50229_01440 [Campylobacterota bacterium]
MVKKFFAFLVWIALVLILVIVFLPKKELYYLAESYLLPLKININEETASDRGLVFSLQNGQIIYDRMNITRFDEIALTTTLFYNALEIKPFVLSSEVGAFLPRRIERLKATHHIFMPHIVNFSGEGEFGSFKGKLNLIDRKMAITLDAPSEVQQKYSQIVRMMNRTEEGLVYELQF